ncbi:uncharacterized protein PG998_009046 [Apiospora kogelbergensis]|uniref:Heterokaryon incompatibility domain-containing protein n=1 Tax=Apiospora kogelbergensis TaxID=1337665 RepID=A0AAW0R6L5_9PEZI
MDSTPKPWSHIYSTLSRPDSIRLLELEPAADHVDPLQGYLMTTTLEEVISNVTHHYTALSYVWGDSIQSGSIHISGCQVQITANLAQALRDIRHPSIVSLMWADALCINQQDNHERSHQVRIMGDIYRRAASTIIYLGPLQPNGQCLFEHIASKNLKRLSLQTMDRTNYDSGLRPLSNPSIDSSSSSDAESEQGRPYTNPDFYIRLGKAVDEICSSDWFTRAWVFQELVLSVDPRIQCGQSLARWSDVAEVVALENARTEPMLQSRKEKIQAFLKMDMAMNGKGQNTMRNLIRARTGSHVTDPRDFFYSLMGIADDRQEWDNIISMDYDVPVWSLYASVAYQLLDRGDILLADLLSYQAANPESSIQSHSSVRSILPSWVPDWNVITNNLVQHMEKTILSPQRHNGSPRIPNEILVLPFSQMDPKRIEKLSGLIPGRWIELSDVEALAREASAFFLPDDHHNHFESEICRYIRQSLPYLQAYNEWYPSEMLDRGDAFHHSESTMKKRTAFRQRRAESIDSLYTKFLSNVIFRQRGEPTTSVGPRLKTWARLLHSAGPDEDILVRNETTCFRLALLCTGAVVAVPTKSRRGDELLVTIVSPNTDSITFPEQSIAFVGRPLSGRGFEATNVGIARYSKHHFLEPIRKDLTMAVESQDQPTGILPRAFGKPSMDKSRTLERIRGMIDLKDEEFDVRHYSLIGTAVDGSESFYIPPISAGIRYAAIH